MSVLWWHQVVGAYLLHHLLILKNVLSCTHRLSCWAWRCKQHNWRRTEWSSETMSVVTWTPEGHCNYLWEKNKDKQRPLSCVFEMLLHRSDYLMKVSSLAVLGFIQLTEIIEYLSWRSQHVGSECIFTCRWGVLKQEVGENKRAGSLIQSSDTSNSLLTHAVTLENSTENSTAPFVCMCAYVCVLFNPAVWDYITSNRQRQIKSPVIWTCQSHLPLIQPSPRHNKSSESNNNNSLSAVWLHWSAELH